MAGFMLPFLLLAAVSVGRLARGKVRVARRRGRAYRATEALRSSTYRMPGHTTCCDRR